MKISKKGEYALRAMMDLSLNYGRGVVKIREISEKENIPEKFLEQILLSLKKAGLVESRRGVDGGYALIKDPKEISIAQVLRLIDGPLAPLSCVSKMAHVSCPEEKNCGLYSVMKDVRNAIAMILEGVTISDIASRTKRQFRKKASK